jgi:lambda repressor-like predicted transcriptional regulator
MMKKPIRIILALGLVGILALSSTIAVSARGPSPARGRVGGAHGTEAIAEALGMSVEELRADLQDGKTVADIAEERGVELQSLKNAADAAQDAAVRESIEAAVTEGQLTREQADWMLQGLDAGYTLGGRGRFFGRMPFSPSGTDNGLEAAAQALGMTLDELSLQLWGGRSLADLAERNGVSLDEVQSAIETARQEAMRQALAQAVENGRMTQEQADWLLQGMEQGFGPRGGMMDRGRLPGGLRGHGGLRGRGSAPDSDADSDAGFRGLQMPGSESI